MSKSVDICSVFGGREYIDYKLFLDYVAKDDIKELAFGVNIDDDGNVEYKNFRILKHGHWIAYVPHECPSSNLYKCSVCNKGFGIYGHSDVSDDRYGVFSPYDYCPNCGAIMDGEIEFPNYSEWKDKENDLIIYYE